MPGALPPRTSPTLRDMKKDEAIPPSSNTTRSSSSQRQPAGGTEEPATLFDIPLPEREVGGAILKPSTRTLRIQE